MKTTILFVLALLFFNSCIPIKIAPKISDYKLTTGKKFNKGLPKKSTFIFEDPKQAGEFYNYINIKFDLKNYFVDTDVPFSLDGNKYFLSFYEVEKNNKALNLVPLAFDLTANVALNNDRFQPYTMNNNNAILRSGTWYIAIEVYSDSVKDCLSKNAISRERVLAYLSSLKQEYLSTHNYNEVVFKN